MADQLIFNKVDVVIPETYNTVHQESLSTKTITHQQLRVLAANYIRKHSEDFTPFLEMSVDDLAFEEYCNKVQSETLCEWGGQLEIKAICACLGIQILVYSADSPVLVMGDESRDVAQLRISFHRHYFALGEHYNSVVSATSDSHVDVSSVFNTLNI